MPFFSINLKNNTGHMITSNLKNTGLKKNLHHEVQEMAHCLRTLTTLAETPGLSSQHPVAFYTFNCSSRASVPSSDLQGQQWCT